MATAISDLFDQVLMLNEGEKIVLKFETLEDLESKRILLYREKKKYEQATKGISFKSFFISRNINKAKGIFELKLSTNGTSLDWLTSALITKQGEEARKLNLGIQSTKAELERLEMLKEKDTKK